MPPSFVVDLSITLQGSIKHGEKASSQKSKLVESKSPSGNCFLCDHRYNDKNSRQEERGYHRFNEQRVEQVMILSG